MGDEAYGPKGDPSRHLEMAALQAAWEALEPPPRDHGRVAMLVARQPDGSRELPQRVVLSSQDGLTGDRWARTDSDRPDRQLAVMRRDVAELVANGQPIEHAGDNLFVDLDLSTDNLPIGSRLRVGKALVEVSAEPHTGCLKFRGRFGADALKFISNPALRDTHLRGIYWTVIEAGEVAVGDSIEVVSRAGSSPG